MASRTVFRPHWRWVGAMILIGLGYFVHGGMGYMDESTCATEIEVPEIPRPPWPRWMQLSLPPNSGRIMSPNELSSVDMVAVGSTAWMYGGSDLCGNPSSWLYAFDLPTRGFISFGPSEQASAQGVLPPQVCGHAWAGAPNSTRVFLFGGLVVTNLTDVPALSGDLYVFDAASRAWDIVWRRTFYPTYQPSQRVGASMAVVWSTDVPRREFVVVFGGKEDALGKQYESFSRVEGVEEEFGWRRKCHSASKHKKTTNAWGDQDTFADSPCEKGYAGDTKLASNNAHVFDTLGAGEWRVVKGSTSSPAARTDQAMTSDGNRVFLFGGSDPYKGIIFDDLWTLEPPLWQWKSLSDPTASGTPRFRHRLVYWPPDGPLGLGSLVAYGGANESNAAIGDVFIAPLYPKTSFVQVITEGPTLPPTALSAVAIMDQTVWCPTATIPCADLIVYGGVDEHRVATANLGILHLEVVVGNFTNTTVSDDVVFSPPLSSKYSDYLPPFFDAHWGRAMSSGEEVVSDGLSLHTLQTLSDGSASYVYGGYTTEGNVPDSLHYLHIPTLSWMPVNIALDSTTPGPLLAPVMAIAEHTRELQLYVFGGIVVTATLGPAVLFTTPELFIRGLPTDVMWEITLQRPPILGTPPPPKWTAVDLQGQVPGARAAATWTKVGSVFMFVGGFDKANRTRCDVWQFESYAREWIQLYDDNGGAECGISKTAPIARMLHASSWIDELGALFVHGGVQIVDGSTTDWRTLKDAWTFSPVTGSWTSYAAAKSTTPFQPMAGHVAAYVPETSSLWLIGDPASVHEQFEGGNITVCQLTFPQGSMWCDSAQPYVTRRISVQPPGLAYPTGRAFLAGSTIPNRPHAPVLILGGQTSCVLAGGSDAAWMLLTTPRSRIANLSVPLPPPIPTWEVRGSELLIPDPIADAIAIAASHGADGDIVYATAPLELGIVNRTIYFGMRSAVQLESLDTSARLPIYCGMPENRPCLMLTCQQAAASPLAIVNFEFNDARTHISPPGPPENIIRDVVAPVILVGAGQATLRLVNVLVWNQTSATTFSYHERPDMAVAAAITAVGGASIILSNRTRIEYKVSLPPDDENFVGDIDGGGIFVDNDVILGVGSRPFPAWFPEGVAGSVLSQCRSYVPSLNGPDRVRQQPYVPYSLPIAPPITSSAIIEENSIITYNWARRGGGVFAGPTSLVAMAIGSIVQNSAYSTQYDNSRTNPNLHPNGSVTVGASSLGTGGGVWLGQGAVLCARFGADVAVSNNYASFSGGGAWAPSAASVGYFVSPPTPEEDEHPSNLKTNHSHKNRNISTPYHLDNTKIPSFLDDTNMAGWYGNQAGTPPRRLSINTTNIEVRSGHETWPYINATLLDDFDTQCLLLDATSVASVVTQKSCSSGNAKCSIVQGGSQSGSGNGTFTFRNLVLAGPIGGVISLEFAISGKGLSSSEVENEVANITIGPCLPGEILAPLSNGPGGNTPFPIRGSDTILECTSCATGSYTFLSGVDSDDCLPCPPGGNCSAGGSLVRALPGWWGHVYEPGSGAYLTINFTACPAEPGLMYCSNQSFSRPIFQYDNATGAAVVVGFENSCGANRQGVLCGSCIANHSQAYGTPLCIPDEYCGHDGARFIVMGLVLLFIYAAFLWGVHIDLYVFAARVPWCRRVVCRLSESSYRRHTITTEGPSQSARTPLLQTENSLVSVDDAEEISSDHHRAAPLEGGGALWEYLRKTHVHHAIERPRAYLLAVLLGAEEPFLGLIAAFLYWVQLVDLVLIWGDQGSGVRAGLSAVGHLVNFRFLETVASSTGHGSHGEMYEKYAPLCPFRRFTRMDQMWTSAAMPLLAAVALGVLTAISTPRCRRMRRAVRRYFCSAHVSGVANGDDDDDGEDVGHVEVFRRRVTRAWVMLALFSYVSVTASFSELTNCVDVAGLPEPRLLGAGDVQCGALQQVLRLVFGLLVLFPVLLAIVMVCWGRRRVEGQGGLEDLTRRNAAEERRQRRNWRRTLRVLIRRDRSTHRTKDDIAVGVDSDVDLNGTPPRRKAHGRRQTDASRPSSSNLHLQHETAMPSSTPSRWDVLRDGDDGVEGEKRGEEGLSLPGQRNARMSPISDSPPKDRPVLTRGRTSSDVTSHRGPEISELARRAAESEQRDIFGDRRMRGSGWGVLGNNRHARPFVGGAPREPLGHAALADEVEWQLEGACARCAQTPLCRPCCIRLAHLAEDRDDSIRDSTTDGEERHPKARQWTVYELLHEELARPFRATSRVAQAHSAFLLLQRELMTLARAFVTDVVVRQLVLLVLCLAAIIFQVWTLPYESRGTNLAQTVLLFSLFCITAAGFPGAIYGAAINTADGDISTRPGSQQEVEALFGIDSATAVQVVVAADIVILVTLTITILFLFGMAACYIRFSIIGEHTLAPEEDELATPREPDTPYTPSPTPRRPKREESSRSRLEESARRFFSAMAPAGGDSVRFERQ